MVRRRGRPQRHTDVMGAHIDVYIYIGVWSGKWTSLNQLSYRLSVTDKPARDGYSLYRDRIDFEIGDRGYRGLVRQVDIAELTLALLVCEPAIRNENVIYCSAL